jgi:hypothetical protein
MTLYYISCYNLFYTVRAQKESEFRVSGYVTSLCVTSQGDFVTLEGWNRVILYSSAGELLKPFTLPEGCKTWSVTVHQGTVIVADWNNDRLHIYDMSGQLLSSIQLEFTPWFLSSDSDQVWVYSHTDSQVHRMCIDDTHQIQQLHQVPVKHDFKFVTAITASRDRFALCDNGSHKVSVFDHAGRLLYHYGAEAGERRGLLYEPRGVLLDHEDRLYIADNDNQRVVRLDERGRLEGYIHVSDYPYSLALYNNLLHVGCMYTVQTYRLE